MILSTKIEQRNESTSKWMSGKDNEAAQRSLVEEDS